MAFEWAWARTKRFRRPNQDLNKIFWMFERKDAKSWKKWKFYLGAMTILLPRLIFSIFSIALLAIIISILLIGSNRDKPLAPGCRKSLIRGLYRLTVTLQGFFSWFTILSHEYTKTDYKEWLGD